MLLTENKLAGKIEKKRILTNLGYRDNAVIPARITSLLDEYSRNIPYMVMSSYAYDIRDIHAVAESEVTIDGGVTFTSQIVAGLLERCEKVAVFALTIGPRLERIVAAMAEDGQVLRASVLDALGSDAAEGLAEYVHSLVDDEAREMGFVTSRRYSPGYCDWDVSQQMVVFQALEDDPAEISLTDDYLMLPRKSISGIIGLGYSDVKEYQPCLTCLKRNCPGRRV